MKKTKKLVLMLLAIMLIVALLPMTVLAEEEEDMILVYAQTPDDWADSCLWAWDVDGADAFDAWPGGKMIEDSNNPGWSYLYVPAAMVNIIVNANEGIVQTTDVTIDPQNVWLVVEEADEGYSATISYDQMTEGDLPECVPTIMIYTQVPEDWEGVSLWAWSAPDGTNAFEAWPGQAMTAMDDGWYSCEVAEWVNSIIINANEGTVQTVDFSIEPNDVWVTVEDAENAEVSYDNPADAAAEDVETFTVHVQAPEDWLFASIWAWSAPDGTNFFVNWPGEEMAEVDGWYTYDVPVWVNSVIINANAGTVQTTDISVEPKNLWIVVEDAENYGLYYEEPEAMDEAVAEEVVEETEEPVAEVVEEASTDTTDQSSANLLWLWIVIGVIAAAAIVIGITVAIKKKKA